MLLSTDPFDGVSTNPAPINWEQNSYSCVTSPIPYGNKIPYVQQSLALRFGQHLKKLRIKQGKTLEKVAYEVDGLTKATLSRIENGLVDPKLSTLTKIAESLEISLLDLMDY